MGIDKSWMSLRNRACNEYEKGIDIFLDFAFKRLGNVKRIHCPCAKCYNVRFKSRTEVKYDLFRNGIIQSYTKWHHHGELSDESSESDAEDVNIPIDQGSRNMETMLEDLFGHVANSSNTNTSDGECTNYPEDPIPEAQNYYRLLEECRQDIYPGCKRYSKLSFLVHLLNLKCLNGWTDKSVTMLLEFLIDLLPNNANIPKSYYEARKIIKDLGLDYVKIDACKNDCVLFRKKLANNDTWPTCGESRWISSSREEEANSRKRKQIPQKVLRFFPLTSRLQRLYMNKEMASNMRWHCDGRQNDGILRHPADSLAWKHFDHNHPEFAIEPRNVRLGFKVKFQVC
uniref:Transposase-associated domain-containing protein n=1 Tax=Ananas comosus var. bracteatus TaxID=296719 RepID=A0A6V7NGS2_ANACO|nr:unnamed protein product [Ananas comosus var. bracteatus]